MRKVLAARIRSLVPTALVVLTLLSALPALAQNSNYDPHHITGSWATRHARYYAPYALQAAVAYVDVNQLDATVGRQDGSDVALAVGYVFVGTQASPDVPEHARKYLRAWQYQFGSDRYLDCYDKSDSDCQAALRGVDRWTFGTSGGPAFHVWARTGYPKRPNAACSEVSIAFRGTTGSLTDWISNFNPVVGRFTDDEYRQLRRNIDAIIRQITTLDCYKKAGHPQIVSVGHSLGGGLAQLAALANNPKGPRITKVFAFDPSPVTGYRLVDRHVLAQNTEGLEIDRIYQSGEVLQRLRRLAPQYPKSDSPCVRTVEFGVLQPAGSVTLHNMSGLARGIVELSYLYGPQSPFIVPGRTSCPSRYVAPATDEDESPAPNLAPGVAVSARHAPHVASFARSTGNGSADDRFATAFPQTAEVDGAAARLVRHRVLKIEGTARVHQNKSVAKRRIPASHVGTKAALL